MTQLTASDVPTVHPPESMRTRIIPPQGKIRPQKAPRTYNTLKNEEAALKVINNESNPDEKWIRFIDSNTFCSNHKRLIIKGKLSTSLFVTIHNIRYTKIEMYLICHKGYDPTIHLIQWKGCDVTEKYLDGEEWRELIINNDVLYASNLGRLHTKYNRLMSQTYNKHGYLRTDVFGKTMYVHRLVWMAFNPDVDISNYVVNHLNHQRDDNRLSNLESVTQQANMAYSYECGYSALNLGRISAVFIPDHKRTDVSNWNF